MVADESTTLTSRSCFFLAATQNAGHVSDLLLLIHMEKVGRFQGIAEIKKIATHVPSLSSSQSARGHVHMTYAEGGGRGVTKKQTESTDRLRECDNDRGEGVITP